ncbi:hypothetical protein SLS56_007167 [Neofusicoccum ribis]|uniref:DUF2423 domain-containing protein n=1 Tax=Neofusicoccum ribis TaxID=45134 RepID=A0ABR3SNN2_9PEZI
MAKGARSTARKTNNQALKARVFGPVETARTERLSQKLLELAQQPRPAKTEMEVEKDESNDSVAQDKAPADQAEGSSKCFSWPVPPSLLDSSKDNNKLATAEEETFYHLLGLSGDIMGFTTQGDLAMEVDGEKPSMTSLKKKTGRVQKKRRGKNTSTITFKNFRTGARKPAAGGKKGGKR